MSISHHQYLRSPLWRGRLGDFLKRSGRRCMMFPWIKVGSHSGDYYPYECHHTHYWEGYQGNERFWWDVLVLSPQAHRFIHRILGGSDRVRNQTTPYPNRLQQFAHAWCRVPNSLKPTVLISPIALLILFWP